VQPSHLTHEQLRIGEVETVDLIDRRVDVDEFLQE